MSARNGYGYGVAGWQCHGKTEEALQSCYEQCPLRAQADEVDKVKRSENRVILNPFSITPNHTIKDADELMAKYRICGADY